MTKTEKQKMLAGELYRPGDPELSVDQAANKTWLVRYNAALALPVAQRHAMLSERLGHVGAGAVIRPPFFCDFGYNISLGDGVFLNFNCVILDVVEVSIGDRTQIGPAVQIYAADHPRHAQTRRDGLEFGRPVRIGCDVWIGGGAIILPGITVGDGAVIGAGSVVTRNVGAGETAVGNPARPPTRPEVRARPRSCAVNLGEPRRTKGRSCSHPSRRGQKAALRMTAQFTATLLKRVSPSRQNTLFTPP